MDEKRHEGEHGRKPHQDDFSEGQADTPRHPEERHGDFARGQEKAPHEHEGDFAEGQETKEHHPEDAQHGDFAKGERGRSPKK
jgi:hypothetical protein